MLTRQQVFSNPVSPVRERFASARVVLSAAHATPATMGSDAPQVVPKLLALDLDATVMRYLTSVQYLTLLRLDCGYASGFMRPCAVHGRECWGIKHPGS